MTFITSAIFGIIVAIALQVVAPGSGTSDWQWWAAMLLLNVTANITFAAVRK